ncbi:MAG: NHLP bacteriocin export ABC transporter permease/ATPase subunit [Candidatus Muiribacterium halophilum]|uniref:NHLP bacteriocin export ABC transporter permease/ATPase subunit n=1 Tax=Muiribacterium halophilum TaxID=2053465 RepID=A0A2N5ZIS9_MUIH1|nr:MAG: NHLP bacteriocin export ABC transporter permease/ATPase subunit [Candidatus Muirbacterium halophilum]
MIKEFFEKNARNIKVDGNTPVILDNPEYIYYVKSGAADIFCILDNDSLFNLRRHFITRIEENNCFFGFSREKEASFIFTGLQNTEVLYISYTDLLSDENKNSFLTTYTDFIKHINDVIREEDITNYTIDEKSNREEISRILSDNLRAIQLRITQRLNSDLEKEKSYFNKKRLIDEKFRHNGLLKLESILNKTKGNYAGESINPGLYVIQVLLKSMQSKEAVSENIIKGNDSFSELLNKSGIAVREIILRPNWYKKDNGTLILLMKDTDIPVAAIQESPGEYVGYCHGKNKFKITSETEEDFQDKGYMVYNSLENKKITPKDLFMFSLSSTWRSDRQTVILMGLLAGLTGLIAPTVTGQLIDKIIPLSDFSLLVTAGLLLISSATASFIFNIVRAFAYLRIEQKIDVSVQSAVWIKILDLPASFFKKYTAGDLASRAMGINMIRQILSGATVNSLIAALFSTVNIFLMFYYNKKLALLGSILILAAGLFSSYFSFKNMKLRKKVINIEGSLSSIVFQMLKGIAKIRTSGAEDQAFFKWSEIFSFKKQLHYIQRKYSNVTIVFNSFFPIIASVIIFAFFILKGARDENTHLLKMSTGHFLAFNAAFTILLSAVLTLSEAIINILDVVPYFNRARPILETETEKSQTGASCGKLDGHIEINRVSFKYDEKGEKILDNVSFSAKPGEFVAIVGPSGSGKSTLLRILLGFEKPETGTLTYDHMDINKLDLKSLRNQLGVVLQNGQLLAGDIYTNIVGARPISLNDAWKAAEEVGLADDVKAMPMGMHTIISEGAGTLSGGQKQRILIAKALVHRPSIIFFDEATSALDNATQKTVSESIEKLNVTRIVIANRLSTIQNADKIIVLDKGKIVESGSYHELMEKDGVFKQIAQRQVM